MVERLKVNFKDGLERLIDYVNFCLNYLEQNTPSNTTDRSLYYIIRYIAIAISRLIEALNLTTEISKRCQDIATLIDMGKAFLHAKYSYADTQRVYTILKMLCPCIKEAILKL